ncbi:unnamed protein product [Peniophora sp. CBMAI 1063]|nr:unnamed protein product [Peniophora sp. CBMAI 1063]
MPISFSSPFRSSAKRSVISRANVVQSVTIEDRGDISPLEKEQDVHPSTKLHRAAAIAAEIGWQGTKELLYLLRDSTDVFPPLKSCIGGLVALVEICERAQGVSKGMLDVTGRLDRVMGLLAKRLAQDNASLISSAIDDQMHVLSGALVKLETMKWQGAFARVIQSRSLQGEVESICRTVVDAIQEIQLSIGLLVERNTGAILQEMVFQSLGRAKSAAYTAATAPYGIQRRSCTPGTRVMDLDHIMKWAVRTRYERTQPVFWLNGLAGQGKTTIAYTICERLERKREDISMVSLFCARQLDSHEEKLLVSTLAFELAECSASYASELRRALQQEHNLGDQILSVQMSKLLIGPWKRSAHARAEFQPTILVIDAIDENDAGLEFVYSLLSAMHAGQLPGLRAFFTSRPGPDLKSAFEGLGEKMVSIQTMNSALAFMWRDSLDIRLYLQEELHTKLDDATIGDVTRASAGLFLYASTVARLVKSKGKQRTRREQETRVRRLIEGATASQSKDSFIAEVDVTILDSLYGGILQDMLDDLDDEEVSARLHVLMTVVCTSQILDVPLLAALAGVEEDLVNAMVEGLHAVLYLDDDKHVFWCHNTFQDYILGTYKEFIPLTRARVVQHCHELLRTSAVSTTAESSIASGRLAFSSWRTSASSALRCRKWRVVYRTHPANKLYIITWDPQRTGRPFWSVWEGLGA